MFSPPSLLKLSIQKEFTEATQDNNKEAYSPVGLINSVADPDLQIMGGEGGHPDLQIMGGEGGHPDLQIMGGEGGHPDPEHKGIRGRAVLKIFFRPFGP